MPKESKSVSQISKGIYDELEEERIINGVATRFSQASSHLFRYGLISTFLMLIIKLLGIYELTWLSVLAPIGLSLALMILVGVLLSFLTYVLVELERNKK